MTERSLAPFLLAVALAFALAFALAACDTEPRPASAGLDVPKTLQVDRQQLDFEVGFPPRSAVLSAAERSKLDDFLTNAAVRPEEPVFLAPAANDPFAAARVGHIVDILAKRNIGAERVDAPPAGVAANHLLLVVKRYVVQQPACPDWSGDPDSDHQNLPASNFGCANMVNLGLMIDNPHDLAIGRALGPFPAEPGLNAIERYRTDTVKALPTISASGNSGGSGGSGSGSGSGAPSSGGASPSGGQ